MIAPRVERANAPRGENIRPVSGYHADFWVAAATVGPVLLLSHVVAAIDHTRAFEHVDPPAADDVGGLRRAFRAYKSSAVYFVAAVLATAALGDALISLADGADDDPPKVDAAFLIVSALVTIGSAYAAADRLRKRQTVHLRGANREAVETAKQPRTVATRPARVPAAKSRAR